MIDNNAQVTVPGYVLKFFVHSIHSMVRLDQLGAALTIAHLLRFPEDCTRQEFDDLFDTWYQGDWKVLKMTLATLCDCPACQQQTQDIRSLNRSFEEQIGKPAGEKKKRSVRWVKKQR